MQFAINYSPEATQLLDEGRIEVDIFKCSDWESLVTPALAYRPAYVHFPLVIGMGQVPSWDFATIEGWLARTTTPYINCHIIPHRDHCSPDMSVDELIETLSAEVQILVNYFGAERVIIENTPNDPNTEDEGYIAQGADPRLLQGIVAETNCGFLLDISHAALTSEHNGYDVYEHLNALPVDRIRELHVTGIGTWTTGQHGDHVPMSDPDWQRLEWVIEQISSGAWSQPTVMAFEYGGIGKLKDLCGSDKNAIAEQVPRLYDLAHSVKETQRA